MLFSKSFLRDLFKYGFVAIFALIADFGSLMLFHSLGMQYILAATLAFLIGTVVNFALSNGYVFKDPVIKNKAVNFSAFAAIGALGLVANDIIIWFFHGKINLNLAIAKLIAVAVVFFWNFLARRQFLFKGNKVSVGKEVSFEG